MPTVKRTVLEFRSDRLLAVAAGLILGSGGAFMLIGSIFAGEGSPAFPALLGVLQLLVAAVCWSYTSAVRLDRRGRIERRRRWLFWEQVRRHSPKDFRAVGVGMAADPSGYTTRAKYFIQLLGAENFSFPGLSSDRDAVVSKAHEVGQLLDLPVEDEPKRVFFQLRF